MSKDGAKRDAVDEELSRIEFPGEDEQWIRSYLDEREFTERVMRAVAEAKIRLPRGTVWGVVALLNVAILVVAWTNPHLVEDVLALKNELFSFFFGFLGLTLAGCIVGLVLSIDFSRLEPFVAHVVKELHLKDLFRHPR